MVRSLLLLAALALTSCAANPSQPASPQLNAATVQSAIVATGGRIVDLSYPYDNATLYWPTDTAGFVLEKTHWGKTDGGYFYASAKMCTAEHGGTHIDAPIHFAEGRPTLDKIALDRLIAPAVVIDISKAAASNPDALLGAADIEAFERTHGRIEPKTIVLVRTGWSERWPDRKRYLGDDKPGDASNLHFPGIGEDAARALVARKVAAVGIDTASIDNGPSKTFMTHRVLLDAEIPGLENLASLKELPARGAAVIALPMKIGGGSGGPLRVVALLPPPVSTASPPAR
ncbi:cyclase family protein [Pendulispora albinea]|uniref:Cyclase family protein n=1 Tax=Pendulispora albinea TaxID=2741071 RepID=A0ABZ2LV64_9BACT